MCQGINDFLLLRLKGKDILSLQCLVPELFGFEQYLHQRVEDPLKIRKTFIYPDVAVVFYQRIPVI